MIEMRSAKPARGSEVTESVAASNNDNKKIQLLNIILKVLYNHECQSMALDFIFDLIY